MSDLLHLMSGCRPPVADIGQSGGLRPIGARGYSANSLTVEGLALWPGDCTSGARLFMGWFDIDSVFGLDLTAVYAVRYEHGRLSGSPLPRASTRRRVGPRSTHAPRFAIRSHDSVW